jgi:tetratricopeptide (TPR) repeat protein
LSAAPAIHAAVPRALQFVGCEVLAARCWAHVAASWPSDPEPLREAALCLMKLGRFEEAAAVSARRTLLAPADPDAWGALAIAALRASRAQEAERALRQVARLCPEDPQPRIAVALALRRRHRTLEALRELRAAVAMPVARMERRFLLGEALFGAEAWHAAVADWEHARRQGQLEAPKAGRSALDSARAADCDVRPAPVAQPAAPGAARALLATLLRRSGFGGDGPEASLRVLRQGLGTLLPLPRLRRSGPDAAGEPSSGLRRPPASSAARAASRSGLAGLLLLVALSVPATAAESAALAVKVVPPAYETREARDAQRACFAVVADEAVPDCERALALGLAVGKASGVARRLALLHAREYRWEGAARAWAALVTILPKEPGPRVAHGHVLSLLGRHEEALAAFDAALALAPDDAEALLGAGTALARLGRTNEAIQRLDAAIRRAPALLDERPALAALREALRVGKPWPEASVTPPGGELPRR